MTKEKMENAIGKRIQERLKVKGMTQKELAEITKTTPAAISHYIKGDRIPRASVLAKISIALETTSEYLLEGIPVESLEEIGYAKKLIARNVNQMSKKEKAEIIDILLGGDD